MGTLTAKFPIEQLVDLIFMASNRKPSPLPLHYIAEQCPLTPNPMKNLVSFLSHPRPYPQKHFLRTKVKPKTKEELLGGIARFWSERVDAEKCSTYIRHLQKVLPIVVERQGKASRH